MPLSRGQRDRLLDAGFLPFEVRQIHLAKAPDGSYQSIDLTGATWQATIASRRRWVERQLDEGRSKDEIRKVIIRFYRRRGAGRDPFAFLKIEYKPPRRLSDFQFAMKLRARKRISWGFGKEYGRRLRPQRRPLGR